MVAGTPHQKPRGSYSTCRSIAQATASRCYHGVPHPVIMVGSKTREVAPYARDLVGTLVSGVISEQQNTVTITSPEGTASARFYLEELGKRKRAGKQAQYIGVFADWMIAGLKNINQIRNGCLVISTALVLDEVPLGSAAQASPLSSGAASFYLFFGGARFGGGPDG